MINVTRTFLPPIEEYESYLNQIWQRSQLTNQGPLLLDFERQAKAYLKVKDFHFVTNGTLALQISLKALDLEGEVITTPFSYVATTSSILWEHCTPVYVDIDPLSLCIDPEKIEAAITPRTVAIMAVHVFGIPCHVERIARIAKAHGLKVIYDGAHAFGVKYKGRSLLSYGDISTCSFHSTKLFHTIEGGSITANDPAISQSIELIKRFGHNNEHYEMPGINAKASEFQAAMGLCNLKHIKDIISARQQVTERYDRLLGARYQRPKIAVGVEYNYGYYPVVLSSEEHVRASLKALAKHDIYPRRYFYPSLNKLPYLTNKQSCPISEDIATRVLCLPLYGDLAPESIALICEVIDRERP